VRAGRFGRKSGAGFYDYAEGAKAPVAATVAAAERAPAVRAASEAGLLGPLVERLRSAGVGIEMDAALPAETLRVGAAVVTLTDGRTLAERRAGAAGDAAPSVLLDLARDYATTSALGATGPSAALTDLAATLKPASIDLIALDDIAGLVVMRTIAGLVNEAADLMTWTGTRAADIDTAMRLGMAYTQGPLAWADAIGASRAVAVLANLHQHYGEPRYRRSPRLARAHFTKGTFHG